jgi:hypothetical protein
VTVIGGVCGLVLAGWWFLWGDWIGSGPKTAQAEAAGKDVVVKETVGVPAVKPARIVGGVGFVPAGKTREEWCYLSEDGLMLTVSEIAALSGGTVSEVKNGPLRKLIGPGVVGVPSEPVSEVHTMPGGVEVFKNLREY